MEYLDFERADQFLLGVIESDRLALVELHQGVAWECGMNLLDQDDKFSQCLGYLTLLIAVRRTPSIDILEAHAVTRTLMKSANSSFSSTFRYRRQAGAPDATPDPALDAQVRPILAWLDT